MPIPPRGRTSSRYHTACEPCPDPVESELRRAPALLRWPRPVPRARIFRLEQTCPTCRVVARSLPIRALPAGATGGPNGAVTHRQVPRASMKARYPSCRRRRGGHSRRSGVVSRSSSSRHSIRRGQYLFARARSLTTAALGGPSKCLASIAMPKSASRRFSRQAIAQARRGIQRQWSRLRRHVIESSRNRQIVGRQRNCRSCANRDREECPHRLSFPEAESAWKV